MMKITKFIPLPLRVAMRQGQRLLQNTFDQRDFARKKSEGADYREKLSGRESLLLKKVPDELLYLQKNKIRSLKIAAEKVDGIVINPGQYFSFWRVVGRPSKRKGYSDGFELRAGEMVKGTGGGICQLTNALCWCAIHAGCDIIERHRHDMDLFPDDNRDIPFGSGATVFFRYKDFIFRNTTPVPIRISACVNDLHLIVSLLSIQRLPFEVKVEEVGHRFYREGENIFRENRIVRTIQNQDEEKRELIFENHARVLYDIEL